jgi:hypothetical protein
MLLEFLCPKGHKIHCPADRAGQAARCPKCGVKFIIPENPSSAPAAGAASPGGGAGSAINTGSGSAKGQIEFLCPNGHILHGARHLQGHAGQCPECGSRFVIPGDEDSGDQPARGEPDLKPAEAAVPVGPVGDSAVDLSESTPGAGSSRSVSPQVGERLRVALQSGSSGHLQRAGESHPLCDVFSRLWAARGEHSVVELRLNNGELLTPHRFARAMSRGSHAVFGLKEADGNLTLAAVAWDSIAQVLVRQPGELPEEMRG